MKCGHHSNQGICINYQCTLKLQCEIHSHVFVKGIIIIIASHIQHLLILYHMLFMNNSKVFIEGF